MRITRKDYRTYSAISDLPYPAPDRTRLAVVTGVGMHYAAAPYWRASADASAVWPVPVVTDADKDEAYSGDTVRLTGGRFFTGCVVTLVAATGAHISGGADVACGSVTVVDDETIDVEVPEGAGAAIATYYDAESPGPNGPRYPKWRVSNEAGADLLDSPTFTPTLPHITDLSPSTAAEGAEVVVTGTGFVDVTGITLDGVDLDEGDDYTVNGPTQITLTVPTGATTGDLVVTTLTGSDRLPPILTIGAGLLDLDFTGMVIPSGADVSRTGDLMYGAIYEGALASTAVDTPLIENRGSGVAGVWVFPDYAQLIASPLDVGGSGWAGFDSPSVSDVLGPDGVSNSAQRVVDASGSGPAQYYIGAGISPAGSESTASLWYKHTSGAPAKASYLGNVHTNPEPERYWRLEPSTGVWRFASIFENHGASYPKIQPAGADAWTLEGGVSNAATGSVDVFGFGAVDGPHALPLVIGDTQEQTLSVGSGELAHVIDSDGNLDIQVDLVTWFDSRLEPDHKPENCFVFKMGGPDGEHSLRYIKSTGLFQLKLRGSDVSGAAFAITHWRWGGALDFRVTYNAATGDWKIRGRIGGVVNNTNTLGEARPSEILGSISADDPLGAVTSCHICHDGAGGGHLPAMVRRVKTYDGADMTRQPCKIMVIGDSLAAMHADSGSPSLASGILTVEEIDSGTAIVDVAVPGASIDDITTQYTSSDYYGDAAIEAIIIQIGTNDLLGLSHSGATVVSDVQDLIDTVAAGNPGADIILVMPPRYGADADYDTYYDAVDGADFTGCAIQSTASADATSLDGVHMTPIYLWDANVHWVGAGRDVAAAVWRSHLVSVGAL